MRAAAALFLIALAAGGCGVGGGSSRTIARTGRVGATFTGPGGLSVRLVRYLPRVAPKHDVTRMATPADGTRFVAFLVRACVRTRYLPIVSESDFSVPLAGGGQATAKFPQTVFDEDFGLLGDAGCERGWVVFQVPRRRRAHALQFELAFTRGDSEGFDHDTTIRFVWTLPARPARAVVRSR